MAKELAPRGITVNGIAPGVIADTPFHASFTSSEELQKMIAATSIGRAGTPADVANLAVFLVSEQAGFITGEIVELNGGAWFA